MLVEWSVWLAGLVTFELTGKLFCSDEETPVREAHRKHRTYTINTHALFRQSSS